MEDSRKEAREDRRRRIEIKKDTDNLIADNGLDGSVLDVNDILESSSDPVVIKLRKLREYGISDEMITEAYGEIASNVENEASAIENLAVVFKKLALYVSNLPNGIVVDLQTGELNKKASQKQAAKLGMSEDLYNVKVIPKSKYKKSEKDLDKFFEKYIIGEKSIDFLEKPKYKIDRSFFGKILESEELNKEIENKDEEDINVKDINVEDIKEEDIKEVSNNFVDKAIERLMSQKTLSNMDLSKISEEEKLKYAKFLIPGFMSNDSIRRTKSVELMRQLFVEYDVPGEANSLLSKVLSKLTGKELDSSDTATLFEEIENIQKELNNMSKEDIVKKQKLGTEILVIEAKLEMAKGTPEYNIILQQRNRLYNQNPDLKQEAQNLRDDSGNLTEEAKNRIFSRLNIITDKEIKDKLFKFKSMEITKLSESEKKQYISFCLVGCINNHEEIRKRSVNLLGELYPDFKGITEDNFAEIVNDISNINGKSLNKEEAMAYVVEMNTTLSQLVIDKKYQQLSQKLFHEKITDKEMEESQFFENKSVDLKTGLNIDTIDLTQSTFQNKFNSSKINFTKEDEHAFDEMYKKTTINSWISSKDEVLKHNYLSLLVLKDKAKENPDIIANGVIDSRLENFNKKNPEIVKKFNSLTQEEFKTLKEEEKEFEKNKVNAKLLDYCYKNVLQNNVKYSTLKSKDKQEYLKYIILARAIAEKTSNLAEKEMLTKLSDRGFELLNTKEKEFIKFDDNGNGILNEKTICSEFKSISVGEIETDFESLKLNTYNKFDYIYTINKLKEYTGLKESDFEELKTDSLDDQMREIEQIRFRKNREREISKNNQVSEIENKKDEVLNERKEFDVLEQDSQSNIDIEDNSSVQLNALKKETMWDRIKRSIVNFRDNYNQSSKGFFGKIIDGFKSKKNSFGVSNQVTTQHIESTSTKSNFEDSLKVGTFVGKVEEKSVDERTNNQKIADSEEKTGER